MNEHLIDQAKKANDMYCKLGEELEYWKERCRLAEGINECNETMLKENNELYLKFLNEKGNKPF